jgi:opacity protein-like surface antigen
VDIRKFCLGWILAASLAAAAQDRSFDVNVSALGSFPRHSEGDSISIDSTNSAGFAVAGRYYWGRHSAAEVNYGYTRGTFYYIQDLTAVHGGFIFQNQGASSNEFFGEYVYRFRPEHRLRPFLLGGGGLVYFRPTGNGTLFGATSQTRGSVVYGAGVDYQLKDRWSLRAQYREVMVLKAPDFFGAGLKTTSRMTLMTPQLGISYRF